MRVEYGMAGCTDGVNRLYTLTNLQARRLLLLPEPPEAATQRVAQAPTQSVTGKLYAWCSMHGWHDLQRRLLDRGRSALESFQEIVRQIRLGAQHAAACGEPVPYVDLERHVYSLPYIQGNRDKFRKVQIFGMDDEGLPLQIVDVKSREVIWERKQPVQLCQPWAQALRIQRHQGTATAAKLTQIFERESGKLIVEFVEQ